MDTNSKNLYSVAFYNLENLFDTIDDEDTLDDDFTPDGRKKWNEKRYHQKIKKLSMAIAEIGEDETDNAPVILGIAEVENYQVVNDLINTKKLKEYHYGIVHYDSSDERGIEVGLLYQKEHFELLYSEAIPLVLINEDGERDFTRDILLVKGRLKGELVYILVNHWPSRRKGTEETQPKRIKAAAAIHRIIESIKNDNKDAKIIIMGDFNDNPNSPSVKQHLINEELYNPYESIFAKGRGTATHEKEWHLFDQIIFSRNFFDEGEQLTYRRAEIFDDYFLKTFKGKRKGSPFRTYIGKWHQGGYSDHFPVYIILEK